MLEVVYPHYLAPTPSMVTVQMHPNLGEGALAEG
jgi:type VI secretion system protein ImpG